MEKKRVRIDDRPQHIPEPPPAGAEPLIPTHVADEAFQRLFLISVFVLIQAWKVYDVVSVDADAAHSVGRLAFLVKYSLVDGVFLWSLPVLNVPYLVFSPLVTLILTVTFNLLNVVLLRRLDISGSVALVAPLWGYLNQHRELTLDGDAVNLNKVLDVDSHIRGRYTLNYLPDSLARFNVFDMGGVCQDAARSPIYVPMEFNMTSEVGSVELQHVSTANKVSTVTFGTAELARLQRRDLSHLKKHPKYHSQDEIFYVELPLYEPGTYKVSKIRDRTGTSVRHVLKTFSFAACPSAKFTGPTENGYVCVGTTPEDVFYDFKLPLVAMHGSSPLTLTFLRRFAGKDAGLLKIKVLATESGNFTDYHSHRITRNILEQELLKNPQILQTGSSGVLEFQLMQVSDSHGNFKKYNPSSDSPDVRFDLTVLNKPVVRLQDPAPQSQLLVGSAKLLKLHALGSLYQQFPLTALIGYTSPSDPLASYNFTQTFTSQQDYDAGFQVERAGQYQLLEIAGGKCPCSITPHTITVKLVEPPSVAIRAESIVDKCVGTTGYNFHFDLVGAPPFLVEYTVFRNVNGAMKPVFNRQGSTLRQLHSNGHSLKYDYKPPGEGSYSIVFKTLRDGNYNDHAIQLDQEKHTYSTYFKQRSKASFFQGSPDSYTRRYTVCKGGQVAVPVYLSGNPPFDLTYNIVDDNNKEVVRHSVQVTSDQFVINTPELKGGRYTVGIKDIVDTSGCAAEFDSQESVEIYARSDIPQVSFESSTSKVTIVEGSSHEIALSVVSSIGRSANDVIEYELTDLAGATHKRMWKGAGNLKVSEAGTYKLVGFKNSACFGTIANAERTVVVSYYPKPSLKVHSNSVIASVDNSLELKSGCHGCTRELTLNLIGKAPFNVEYTIQFPSGRSEPRSMAIEKNQVTIALPTSNAGVYLHSFTGIFDSLYTKYAMQRINSKQVLPRISYEVFGSPEARFEDNYAVQVCEAALGTALDEIKQVPLKLTGKFPFSVNVTMEHESKVRTVTFTDVTSGFLNLNRALDAAHMKLGEYQFTVTGVTDANGCHKKYTASNDVVLTVTGAPNITKSIGGKQYLCVGDHVGYDLDGNGPFRLFYDFNGNQHSAKSSEQFRRLTSEAGVMRVLALADSSANQCMVNFTEPQASDLEIKIHDLPSVEINEGDIIIEDIHQGEMAEITFSFKGTPPFTVKYERYTDASNHKKIRGAKDHGVEQFVLKDIWEDEHKILVNREGTYEPYEVSDAYCTAKKARHTV